MTDAPKVERLPGLITREPTTVAAMTQHFTPQTGDQIPQLWARFFATGLVDGETFGITTHTEGGGFNYSAAFTPAPGAALPDGFEWLTLPAGPYLVSRATTTGGNLSAQFMTIMGEIWGRIVPSSGVMPMAAQVFELYPVGFDPAVPGKTFDFYIPVEP